MIRRLLLGVISVFAVADGYSQDIPLFSQKLTNSFIYNPAMAGHTFGSITGSFRKNYLGVENAPQNFFLSAHTPFANYRFGTGINIYQENVNFLQNTYISAAFAYHLHFNKLSVLSFGVGGEYNMMRATRDSNTGTDDPVFIRLQNGENTPDFSFGVMYQNQYFKAGLAANRLSTAWFREPNAQVLSSYYSGYLQGMIPVRGGEDLFEPYFAFRKFSESNDTWDVGAYYTVSNKLTLGAAMRAGSVVNATVAYRVLPNLLLGYSPEMVMGSPLGGFQGTSHELTLRLDFNNQEYKEKASASYSNAVSYRRKTLTTSTVRKSPGGKSPSALAKAQKRVSSFSPSKRYQNTAKLGGGRKSGGSAKYKGSKSGGGVKRKAPSKKNKYKSSGRRKPTRRR